jgi:hypothetical protein
MQRRLDEGTATHPGARGGDSRIPADSNAGEGQEAPKPRRVGSLACEMSPSRHGETLEGVLGGLRAEERKPMRGGTVSRRCQRDEGENPGGCEAQESYAPVGGLNPRRQESGSFRG